MSETNRYLNGKKHGHWVERDADGNVAEGSYVEGRRHGHWIERYPEGVTVEGPYVDDKKHGFWVFGSGDWRAAEGPYVDGKQHGHWIERDPDGDVEEGPYVQGERHGKWVKMSQTDVLQRRTTRRARERATGYRSMPDRSVEQEQLRSRLSDPGTLNSSTRGRVGLSATSELRGSPFLPQCVGVSTNS